MFEIFGNMDSAEELNKTAEGLLKEGDVESLGKLAKENGIAPEMIEIYVCGQVGYIADVVSAGLGKIEVEEKELAPQDIMKDWTEYLKSQCMESEDLAAAVRRKDKSLKGCMGELLKWSHKHMKDVDEDIKKAAGFSGSVKLGIPGMGQAKKIIRDYYLGGQSDGTKKA